MSSEYPKYCPEEGWVKAKDVKPGAVVEIQETGQARGSWTRPRYMAEIKAIIPTKQENNPMVDTTAGKIGGGTAVKIKYNHSELG
jgi:hypothetical protein